MAGSDTCSMDTTHTLCHSTYSRPHSQLQIEVYSVIHPVVQGKQISLRSDPTKTIQTDGWIDTSQPINTGTGLRQKWGL